MNSPVLSFSDFGVDSPSRSMSVERDEFECKLIDENDYDVLISRYLSQGDRETATHWIDKSYAKKCETSNSLIDFANYIKDLTVVQQYKRISQLILSRHLVRKHIVFAYYYVNALYNLRMYSVIVQLPIGNLMLMEGLPVRYPDAHCGLEDYVDSLSLFSALMVVYGRTYILLENRDFASRCLIAAFLQDRRSLVAEQLLRKYKLVPSSGNDPCFRLMEKVKQTETPGDPRQKIEYAHELYRDGKVADALETTNQVMAEHGLYMDCVILHANCLCYFQDWKKLFLLAHELVSSFPDHHYSWYTVAVYYFTCGNIPAAKNFINKSALMRTAFGEAWIAYGHILAAESENEQALNCYYRAARILPWHYEPKMYIGMQYCRVGVRMAEEFLREASCIRPCDPVVMHERGSYYYRHTKFHTAEQFFNNALIALLGNESEETDVIDSQKIISVQIDPFWQPLISSLGHVSRRLGKFRESINFHSKALMMNPMDRHSMASMAMSYACLGETNVATRYFAKALARAPYDGVVRNALDKLAQLESDYLDYTVFKSSSSSTNTDLERLFSERSLSQLEAKQAAYNMSRSKKMFAEPAKSRLATRRIRQEIARANTRKKVIESADQQQ
ncbi:unnamed protein product [Nippostrongylus brasiliensis]|uniref:Cell division cycle protein 16 homolog (inferred by orthology to a human protein) n=1 Tax=Nippostrongylus brasiliensis TaxID=27835 RepID=A0A0N4YAU3_NIPBR|nr:unnamed protein product [Nippostrongylus brasiliensis]